MIYLTPTADDLGYLAADTAIENMIDDLSDELDSKAAELQQAILSNESDTFPSITP